MGPVIDLYGKFAALKLEKMVALYPGRVFSKPEFTALPPCIFSGAEFSLIPSRDEPFGLVAVEFGRKGALGVGARVGGLGNMPGWWYTIESPTTKHLINQFKEAIFTALETKFETRATMRARSRLQRFPVAQWVEDLETLQSKSINIHQRLTKKQRFIGAFSESGTNSPLMASAQASTAVSSAQNTAPNTAPNSAPASRASSPSREAIIAGPHGQISLGRFFGPSNPLVSSRDRSRSASRNRLSKRNTSATRPTGEVTQNRISVVPEGDEDLSIQIQSSPQLNAMNMEGFPFINEESPGLGTTGEGFPPRFPPLARLNMSDFSPDLSANNSPLEQPLIPESDDPLSIRSVVGEQKNLNLQNVNPNFTDTTERYYRDFQKKLDSIDSKASEDQLCIEEFLVKSEKAWFNRFHQVKMGHSATASRAGTPASSVFRMPWGRSTPEHSRGNSSSTHSQSPSLNGSSIGEFLLRDDYMPPTGLKKIMQTKIGDWQLYCFLLAFVSCLNHPRFGNFADFQ